MHLTIPYEIEAAGSDDWGSDGERASSRAAVTVLLPVDSTPCIKIFLHGAAYGYDAALAMVGGGAITLHT